MKDPYLNKIAEILRQLQQDYQNYERFIIIRNQIMEVKTTSEINKILEDNIHFVNDHPDIWKIANNGKRRIIKLQRIKLELTSKIYLN